MGHTEHGILYNMWLRIRSQAMSHRSQVIIQCFGSPKCYLKVPITAGNPWSVAQYTTGDRYRGSMAVTGRDRPWRLGTQRVERGAILFNTAPVKLDICCRQ